ncbi:hypothetical protein ACHAXR_000893, partial [Thalassiosira sp. AJA248-18]
MQRGPAAEESDGDEDDELLMAASAWASTQNEDSQEVNDSAVPASPKKSKSTKNKGSANLTTEQVKSGSSSKYNTNSKPLHNTIPQQKFSLHLTKVPYDASQGDIRFAFGEKGCHVTSVRLVYDRDQKTGEKHFRGVAFVDLADEKSFKRGLEFNHRAFLGKGRKVNVRPTRTKSELSEIVRRTEEKVANLIARSKESNKRERDDDNDGSKNTHHDKDNDSGSNKKRKKEKKRKISDDGSDSHKKDTPASKPKIGDTQEATGKSNSEKKAKSKHNKGAKSEKKDDSPVNLTEKHGAKSEKKDNSPV